MLHQNSNHLEDIVGRRISRRHRLEISARLIAPGTNVRVQLEDVSATGACVRLMQPERLSSARLCWLGHEHYGRVV